MAELIDSSDDGERTDQRLRLSIKWRSITQRQMFPGEAYSQFDIGIFMGETPLFNEAVYRPATKAEGDASAPGYFFGEDDNCGMLNGIRGVLTKGTPMDFEDISYPLFRLIIGADAFDCTDADSGPLLFDVVVILQAGAVCHGGMIGTSGPAMMLNVTPQALARFYDDLVYEALDLTVSDELSRDVIKRFARPAEGENRALGEPQ